MIGRSLNADLRKMKGTSVILAHLLIPIITSVIFLIYYFFSPWNENMKVIAFYQAIEQDFRYLLEFLQQV